MIDPTFKEQLTKSLHAAVNYFNSGMSPTEAVVKSANDQGFNAEQAKRLTETFNTARTIYHFDKNAGSDAKAAKFELADSDGVILGLFRPREQRKEAGIFDYSVYDKVPQNHTIKDIDISFKAASKMDETIKDMSLEIQGHRVNKLVNTYRGMVEEARSKAAMAQLSTEKILRKVGEELKSSFTSKGKDVLNRLCFSMDSEEYKPVFYKLSQSLPSYLRFDPAVRSEYDLVIEDRDLDELKAQVKRAKALLEDAAAMEALAQSVEKDASELRDGFFQLVTQGIPEDTGEAESITDFFTDKTAQAGGAGPIPPALAPSPGKEKDDANGKGYISGMLDANPFASDFQSAESTGFNKMVTDQFANVLLGGDDIAKDNAKLSERLANMQREVLLEDLLVNDPVLRDADQEGVLKAYQSIMSIAPKVSLNKEIMRSTLRQLVHATSMSPFDAQSLVQLEKTIGETKGGTSPAKR